MKVLSLLLVFMATAIMAAPIDSPSGKSCTLSRYAIPYSVTADLMDRGVSGGGRGRGSGGFKRDEIEERGVSGGGRGRGSGGFKREVIEERGVSGGGRGRGSGGFKRDLLEDRGVSGGGRGRGSGGF
jgi:hypothetical protein